MAIRPAYPWTHDDITVQAFNEAWEIVKNDLSPLPRFPDLMRTVLRDIIVYANLNQDFGSSADDLRRHYNRPLRSFETASTKLQADLLFEGYLNTELAIIRNEIAFGAANSEAIFHANNALKAAGRLLHSYQDFYFHGIRRDGAGGSEFNLRPGFKAWTGSPVQTGNPFSRGCFFPCSWGSTLRPGEHGYGEPVGTGTHEKEARFNAAKIFCRNQLVVFVRSWWSAYGAIYPFGC